MAENVFETIQKFRTDQEQTVTDVRDTLVTNITLSESTDATVPEVAEAVAGQTNTLLANVAAVTALQQQQLGAGNSGVAGIEAFEYVNATDLDPALWSVRATIGALTTAKIAVADGHNAGMVNLGAGDVTEMARYIGPNRKTLTNYQKNTVVVAAGMDAPGFFDGRMCATLVFGRISDDELSWVCYAWNTNGILQFYYRNNGGPITQLGGDLNTYIRPPVGAALSIECGLGATERAFRLMYNADAYLPINDTTMVTALDAPGVSNCKGVGWGQRAQDGLMPGKVTQFTFADNKPANTRGVGFRAYRSSTSGAAVTINSDQPCSMGTFDVVDRITPDMSWDGQRLTIGTEGWYQFGLRYKIGQTQGNGQTWLPSIYRLSAPSNAHVLTAYGDGAVTGTTGSNGGFTGKNTYMGGGPITLYCQAGDVITPGYYLEGTGFGAAPNIVGDGAGVHTWFTAVLLNRSLA